MLADYHVHTEFSDDSVYPLSDVVRDAAASNLDEICITDHVDYGVKVDWDSEVIPLQCTGEPQTNVDYPRWDQAFTEVQAAWADTIAVRRGMEFGIQTHTLDQYAALFKRFSFDFILLSIHQVGNEEFWTYEFQQNRSQEDYNRLYYEEMLGVVENFHDYSVLAHLDLMRRYDPHGAYPFEKVRPIIEKILQTVIADGKGIEINTSSHWYGLDDSMPSTPILQLYHDLGGRIITLGSDSHAPGRLGTWLRAAKRQLLSLGFTEFCTYEQMTPVFHPL